MQKNARDDRKMMPIITDVRTITAYTHYLLMRGQLAGNLCFDGHSASAEETHVAEQLRLLCDKISSHIAVCKESDIPDLLECYDIGCRIGHKRLPDSDFINRNKCRLIKAWKAGHKGIEESSIFGILTSEVSNYTVGSDREYLTTYLSIKERWLATLIKYDYFPNVTSYENYQRLSYLMREKLPSQIGYDAEDLKRRWYEHNQVEDLSTLSSSILRSYRRFVGSLFPTIMDFDKKMELDNEIIAELASRTDIDPYDREAFRLALKFNREMIDN